ncbi:class I SAM-dependent methyltransferase [Gemmatimonadota bacterium]
MKESTERFYAELRRDYDRTIRQLVPRYDDMAQVMIGLIASVSPDSLLDIGPGPGSFTRSILEEVTGVRVTAVEASLQMAEESALALTHFGARARVVCQDVMEFTSEESFDAVVTSLVLHNITHEGKTELLQRIRRWLPPDGFFLWSDMIRYEDPRIQAHFVDCRTRYALDTGCPPELVEWNFRKEGEEDHPLTMTETVDRLFEAGFSSVETVWVHDAFAVFCARC